MLTRDDDGVDANGLAAFILDGHLRLAVGAKVIEHAVAPRARQRLDELVRQHDRQRHELFGLVARIAEHQPLIAGASRIDAHADVGRLLVQRRQHAARVGVEAVFGAGVADIADGGAGDFLKIDDGVGRDLAGEDDQAGGDEGFAGDAAFGVLGKNRVEDRIGNLIGDLVRVSFGDGLRGE